MNEYQLVGNEKMFCPKCGRADQQPETYCRQCGSFLPDLDKPGKKKITPQEHLKVNSVLSLMTAIVSLTLAIMLYIFIASKETSPILLYVTAGFMLAMCGWQIQTFWRTLLLKKHFKRQQSNREAEAESTNAPSLPKVSTQTNKLLDEADFQSIVPPSVVENTTKHLKEKINRSSS